MRDYELMTIFPIEEDKTKAGLETLRAVLAEYGVQVQKEEVFGDKDLCYEVKKYNRGHYVLFELKSNPSKIADIDRQFKLNENLLKYLFVRKDSKEA